MKDGFKIYWTPHALEELTETIEYLQNNFSDKEITKLVYKIEETIQLISQNPELFKKSEFADIRRVPILKFNTLYYRIKNNEIEIISFFSNRRHPDKRNM